MSNDKQYHCSFIKEVNNSLSTMIFPNASKEKHIELHKLAIEKIKRELEDETDPKYIQIFRTMISNLENDLLELEKNT